MMERIVVINDLSDAKGGASFLAIESARAFARRGHQVTFLCGDRLNPSLAGDGLECVALEQDRLLTAGRSTAMIRGLYNPQAHRMVADWIAANDTPGTVYHLHGWSQILSPSIFRALRRVDGRLIMSAHDFFLTCPNGAMFNYREAEACGLKPMSARCFATQCDRRSNTQKIWRLVRHMVLHGARGPARAYPPQLLIHAGMARYFARAGVGKGDMFVLPNPVTPYCRGRVPAEANSHALFVGRIEETKGIALAAEACRRAGVKLLAVGDGAQLAALRAQYPEHEWLGRLDPTRIIAAAEQARFAVMPSIYMEPFGLSAIEAMWSGLPLLCSRQSLLAPDIEAAGAGFGINPADIESFALAITRLKSDDAAVARMSHAAHGNTGHLALQWDVWVDRLLDAYVALLRDGKHALSALAENWRGMDRNLPATTPGPSPENGVMNEEIRCVSM